MRTRKVTVLTIAVIMTAGCAQQHQNRFNFGKPDWKSGKQQRPQDVPDPTLPQILPKTHLAAARLHEQQGLIDEAVRQYRKAIALNHQYVEAYHGLGVLLVRIGRVAEAVDALAKAVQLAPNNALLRNNLGYALMRQQEWEPATVQFTRATRLQPFFARAHINLGMTLGKLGRFDEALASFRAVLPLADAYYNQGLMLRAQQRYEESIEALEKVLEINPNFTAAAQQIEQLAPYMQPPVSTKLARATGSPERLDEQDTEQDTKQDIKQDTKKHTKKATEKDTERRTNAQHRVADSGASPPPSQADQAPRSNESTMHNVHPVAPVADVVADQQTRVQVPTIHPSTTINPSTMIASALLPDGNVRSVVALMEELDLSCPDEDGTWEDTVIASEADWVVQACVTYGDNLVAAILLTTDVTGEQVAAKETPSARQPAPDAGPPDQTPVAEVERPVDALATSKTTPDAEDPVIVESPVIVEASGIADVSADPEDRRPLAAPIDWDEAFAALGQYVDSDQLEEPCDENEWPDAVLRTNDNPTIVATSWSSSAEQVDERELVSQADRACLADPIPAEGRRPEPKPQPRDFVAEMQRQTTELRELREDIACLEAAVAAQSGFVDLDVSFADAGDKTWNAFAPEMITIIPASPSRSTFLTDSIGEERRALYEAVLIQDTVMMHYNDQLLSPADRIAVADAAAADTAVDRYDVDPCGLEQDETNDAGSILTSAADFADNPRTLSMTVVQPITYSTDDAPIVGLEQGAGVSGVYKIRTSELGTAMLVSDHAIEGPWPEATLEDLFDVLSIVSNDVNCWDARELQQTIAPLINWSDGDAVPPEPFSSRSSPIHAYDSKASDSTGNGHSKRRSAASSGGTWPRYRIGRRAPARPIPPIRD